jgi:hypothetical protein
MTERQEGTPGEPDVDNPADARPAEAQAEGAATEDNPTELEADIAEEAEETEAPDETEAPETQVAPPVVAIGRPTGRGQGRFELRRPSRPAAPGPTPSEQAVRIDDRVSQVFVFVTAALFVLIFLNALLLGRGGTFSSTPIPSPSASVAVSPSSGASPAASGSPGASGSVGPTPGASGSVAPSAAVSPSG